MPDNMLATEFWQWVDKLGKWHFCPGNVGRQVRLHWPHDEQFDGKENRFIEVVRKWNLNESVINIAIKLNLFWDASEGIFCTGYTPPGWSQDSKCEYPPYLPYLVCFSMAWDEEGSYSSNAYYKRLNDLLELQEHEQIGTLNFRYIDRLWGDIEYWSNEIKGGELGLFRAVSAGHMVHVGYPLSQVVLSPTERKVLHEIFVYEGYTPEIYLSDHEINSLLSEYQDRFKPRTQAAINRNNPTFIKALYEEIRIELESFNEINKKQIYKQLEGASRGSYIAKRNHLQLAFYAGYHKVEWWTFTTLQEVLDYTEIQQDLFTVRPGQSAGILWQQTPQGDTPDPMKFEGLPFLGTELYIEGRGKNFSWPDWNVRFFSPSNSGDGLILEQNFIPETGPVSILIFSSDIDQISNIATDELHGNIPIGCKLFITNDVIALEEKFPERCQRSRNLNPIGSVGGIQVYPREDNYFAYSLPKISILSGWELESGMDCVKLTTDEETGLSRINITTNDFPKKFTIYARKGEGHPKVKRIKVSYHPPIAELSLTSDNFGVKPEAIINEPPKEFPVWPDDQNGQTVDFLHISILQLWEIMSTWGNFSYRKFYSTILELFKEENVKPPRIARYMQTLGHIDIDTSSTNGQWNGIRMSKGCLCRLPWNTSDGKNVFTQAVLRGQVHWGQLLSILKEIPEGIKFDISEQPLPLAPPRLRFCAKDTHLLGELAKCIGVKWENWTAQYNLPSITEILTGFEERNWIDGQLSSGESVTFFSPYHLEDYRCNEYRLNRLRKICGQFLLATQEQTYGLQDFYLLDTLKKRRLKLLMGERQWARWISYIGSSQIFYQKLSYCQQENNQKTNIAIPYDSTKGLLAFPISLVPPMTITRLLCSCSGLLPSFLKWENLSSNIEGLDTKELDKFDSPFFFQVKDMAIVYKNIPKEIANSVVLKLGGILKEIKLGNTEDIL